MFRFLHKIHKYSLKLLDSFPENCYTRKSKFLNGRKYTGGERFNNYYKPGLNLLGF
jgi:hypothetical protein